jgi:hypothetical protein
VGALEWAAFTVGCLVVLGVELSIIRTLVVPRGLASKTVALVADLTRKAFLTLANLSSDFATKDRILVLHGPAMLVAILVVWLTAFLLGFSLMLMPFVTDGFEQAIRESGSSMLTLGYAGSHGFGATTIHFIAAATGLITVALQIAYLPTLYSAFNRRETLVTMLQSRAGAPAWGPEILSRHHVVGLMDNLPYLFTEWEQWSADVAESHSSYPMLVHFRSPAPLRSWIVSLLAVMDAAALHASFNPSQSTIEARLCIRMGFLALREIATAVGIAYNPDPLPSDPIELTYEEYLGAYHRLAERGYEMEVSPEEAWPHFRGWRVNYESIAYAIADYVVAPPGPWSGPRQHLPGLEIVPQPPANRTPENPEPADRGRGTGAGF